MSSVWLWAGRSRLLIRLFDNSKDSYATPTFGLSPPPVELEKLHVEQNLHLHLLTKLG